MKLWFFKDLGLIEKYGSGIKRIIDSFKKAELPPPEFCNISDDFMVTVYGNVAEKTGGINDLLKFIHNNPGKRTIEISKALGIPSRTVEKQLAKLKKDKYVEYRCSKKTGGYFAVKD